MTAMEGVAGNERTAAAGFGVFAVIWAMVQLIELLAWPFWMLAPWGWLVFLAACSVLLRPSSVPRFTALVAAAFAKTLAEMPFVPNHVLMTWIQNGVILLVLLALWRRRRRAPGAGECFSGFAPLLRAQLVALYLVSGLQKLNADYLDPAVSCAAAAWTQIASDLRILPVGDWTSLPAIHGSLVAELGIPLLLIFARTRAAGIALALLFHGLLGFHENSGVYGFSIFMYAQLALFLPGAAHERLAGAADWPALKPLRIGSGRAIAWLCILSLFLLLRSQAWLYWNIGQEFEVFRVANRLVLVWWTILSLVLAAGYLAALRGNRKAPLSGGAGRPLFAALAVAPVLANTALPWLGLKTQTSFSMFSNLRTEFEPNHLFLRRVPLFDLQDDMVEVLRSSPDLFAPAINPNSIQQYANTGRILPMFELRRLAGQVEGALEVEFMRAGGRFTATRDASGEIAGATEVFDRPPLLARKFLWFRRHENFEGPMCCTH